MHGWTRALERLSVGKRDGVRCVCRCVVTAIEMGDAKVKRVMGVCVVCVVRRDEMRWKKKESWNAMDDDVC